MSKGKNKPENTVFVKFDIDNGIYKKGYGGNGYFFDKENLICNLKESEADRIIKLCPDAFSIMKSEDAISELKKNLPKAEIGQAEVDRVEREIKEVEEIIKSLTPPDGEPDADAKKEIYNQKNKLAELNMSLEDMLIVLQAKSQGA